MRVWPLLQVIVQVPAPKCVDVPRILTERSKEDCYGYVRHSNSFRVARYVYRFAIHLLSLPERAAPKEAFEHAQTVGTTRLEATPVLNRFAKGCAPKLLLLGTY